MGKSAPEMKEREPLSGLVERVTFHSGETGFCVLRPPRSRHRGAADIHAREHIQALSEQPCAIRSLE
jgi:hypothetical protein